MRQKIIVEKLRDFAEKFVADEPGRLKTEGWWQTPLLATAPIDPRFDLLPQIAADDHLHPLDLLSTANSVIVFFIPFKKELIKENKKGGKNGHAPAKNSNNVFRDFPFGRHFKNRAKHRVKHHFNRWGIAFSSIGDGANRGA